MYSGNQGLLVQCRGRLAGARRPTSQINDGDSGQPEHRTQHRAQNRRLPSAAFYNHSPRRILHDKKDTQAAILVRGRTRLSPQRPDDARPGTRLLPQPGPSRYKSRNPGTPIRNRDGGIADRTSHNAILFPGSDLHRPPGCFRDTPHPAPAVLWDRFFIPPLFSGRFYCYFDNK